MTSTDPLLPLLLGLQALGVEPVRHGRYVGLRGQSVGKVPAALWDLFERQRQDLQRHLKDEMTPFQRRRRR